MSDNNLRAKERIDALVSAGKKIEHKHMSKERDLLVTKWPDYRFLGPDEATILFAKTYQSAFKDRLAKCFDAKISKSAKGIDFLKLKTASKEYTQMWIARQNADEMTMPYRMYVSFCLDFALRRNRRQFPRPNQLRASKTTEFAWFAEFQKMFEDWLKGGAFRPSDLPQYALENYRALPAQDDFRKYVIYISKMSGWRLRRVIEERVFEKSQLPLEMCCEIRGDDAWEQAVQSLTDEHRFRPATSFKYAKICDADMWQSCFGVPNARDPQKAPCSWCPQSAQCERIGRFVLNRIAAQTGEQDPIAAAKRRSGRNRVEKFRAKQVALQSGVTGMPQ